MVWRGFLVCIAMTMSSAAFGAQDLSVALGLGKYSRSEFYEARPLFSLCAEYVPWAKWKPFYPEFVVGYWSAEERMHHAVSVSGFLDNGYSSRDQYRTQRGVYAGIRAVVDDERRAREEKHAAWPAVGVGGLLQWTDPRLNGGNLHGRAMGFFRLNFPLDGRKVFFVELEGQTDFDSRYSYHSPGIEAVLRVGHRFRL